MPNSSNMPCPSSVIDNMIEQQIRPWGVLDQKTLDLFHTIRRADFVPSQYQNLAYADVNIPLYQEQFMLEPKVQAHIIQALQLEKQHRVLLIAAETGFLAALIACLSGEIVAYESNEDCFQQAMQNLQQYNIHNVQLLNENGLKLEQTELFDKIIICGTVHTLPQNIIDSLQVFGQLIYFKKATNNDVLSDMCLFYKSSHTSVKESVLLQASSPILRYCEADEEFVF